MKTDYLLIPLRRQDGTLRAHAIIDAADAEQARHRWYMTANGYAARRLSAPALKDRHRVYLHREILGLTAGDGMEADHRNRERLDCRRANLHAVTLAENAQNKGALGGRSQYRGVYWNKQSRKWQAKAVLAGRQIHIGLFLDEHEAGEAARRWRMANMPHAHEDDGRAAA